MQERSRNEKEVSEEHKLLLLLLPRLLHLHLRSVFNITTRKFEFLIA